MTEYRIRESGDIKSQGEIRAMHKNTSFPRVWRENVHESIGIDPVLITPKPEASAPYKIVVRNGAVQTGGNWVQAWVEQDMFATDGEGTKADKETAYQANLDAAAAERVRTERDSKLAKTDWLALSDTTMSSEWTTYREALRDVPEQGGFPDTVTWPTEPSQDKIGCQMILTPFSLLAQTVISYDIIVTALGGGSPIRN